MERSFEIKSCVEILTNDIKFYTIYQCHILQLIQNYGTTYTYWNLHPLSGKTGLVMYDIF